MLEKYIGLMKGLLDSGVQMSTVKSTIDQLLDHRGLPESVSMDLYSVSGGGLSSKKIATLTFFFADNCLFEGAGELEGVNGWLEYERSDLKIGTYYVIPLGRNIEDSGLVNIVQNVRKSQRTENKNATAILSVIGKSSSPNIGLNWGELVKFRSR